MFASCAGENPNPKRSRTVSLAEKILKELEYSKNFLKLVKEPTEDRPTRTARFSRSRVWRWAVARRITVALCAALASTPLYYRTGVRSTGALYRQALARCGPAGAG